MATYEKKEREKHSRSKQCCKDQMYKRKTQENSNRGLWGNEEKKKGNYRINNCSKLSRPQSVQEHVRMKWQAYLFGVVQATVYWMYRPESAQGKKRRIKERPLLWIQTDPPIQKHTL